MTVEKGFKVTASQKSACVGLVASGVTAASKVPTMDAVGGAGTLVGTAAASRAQSNTLFPYIQTAGIGVPVAVECLVSGSTVDLFSTLGFTGGAPFAGIIFGGVEVEATAANAGGTITITPAAGALTDAIDCAVDGEIGRPLTWDASKRAFAAGADVELTVAASATGIVRMLIVRTA